MSLRIPGQTARSADSTALLSFKQGSSDSLLILKARMKPNSFNHVNIPHVQGNFAAGKKGAAGRPDHTPAVVGMDAEMAALSSSRRLISAPAMAWRASRPKRQESPSKQEGPTLTG